jgi:hypothetical protein
MVLVCFSSFVFLHCDNVFCFFCQMFFLSLLG